MKTAATTLARAVDLRQGYQDLRTAIVHRACVDYLLALRGDTHHHGTPIGTPEQIERFFHSTWFRILCDADGDAMIRALREMSKQDKISVYYGKYSFNEEE